MNKDIPTIEVIKHWIGWGCDGDYSEERVQQFEEWLEKEKQNDRTN